MSKRNIIRLVVIALGLVIGIYASAQGRVTTQKYRLADFTDKVTKVVVPGSDILSASFQEEVTANWSASPFEFCSVEQFEKLKTSDQYYFLLAAEIQMKGEETPGLVFLTLVKGGPEAAAGIGEMNEVISIPLCAAPGGTGRELVYIGAMIKAVQEFALAAMESEKVAYSRMEWFNSDFRRHGAQKRILISNDDLAPSVTPGQLSMYLDEDMLVKEEADVDQEYMDGTYNTLVSYVVAPSDPVKGSVCYKMFFSADTKTISYLTRHKISPAKEAGFLTEDLKKIAKKR